VAGALNSLPLLDHPLLANPEDLSWYPNHTARGTAFKQQVSLSNTTNYQPTSPITKTIHINIIKRPNG